MRIREGRGANLEASQPELGLIRNFVNLSIFLVVIDENNVKNFSTFLYYIRIMEVEIFLHAFMPWYRMGLHQEDAQ